MHSTVSSARAPRRLCCICGVPRIEVHFAWSGAGGKLPAVSRLRRLNLGMEPTLHGVIFSRRKARLSRPQLARSIHKSEGDISYQIGILVVGKGL